MPKRKPVVVVTQEHLEEFGKLMAARNPKKLPTLTPMGETDRTYFLSMLEFFKQQLEPEIIEGPAPHRTNTYRYTPRQMFDNTMAFLKFTIEQGQPLTVTGICRINRINKEAFWTLVRGGDSPPQFQFIRDCIGFVEMYNEYVLHKKQNPAGAIFALKNFGWKDKLEIEASATQGALTAEERESMQKRIAQFSEVK